MSNISIIGRSRHALGSRGTRNTSRVRFLAVIGVLLATVLAASGCCAGVCRQGPPPIGAGVQQYATH